ncbi:hypothetical protein B0H12DRAFT_1078199 [Mycena haematopus]|nr:hypothetical protein B0H12DRAFT_1078199 [Mycena haematopus]
MSRAYTGGARAVRGRAAGSPQKRARRFREGIQNHGNTGAHGARMPHQYGGGARAGGGRVALRSFLRQGGPAKPSMAKNKWEGMLRHLFHATEATAGEYGLRKSGWRAGSGGGPKQKLGRISVFEGWKRAPLLALPIQQRQIKNGKVPKKAGPPPPLRALDDAAVARASAHAPAAASCYWNR